MRGVTIMVIRYKNDIYRNSKPCLHCCEYMRKVGVKLVIYSIDDGHMISEKIRDISTVHKSMSQKILGC